MATVSLTPCEQLAAAQAQLALLLSGKGVAAIETPQLGRVEFSAANIGDLQKLIDRLMSECAASQGAAPGTGRRRPISIEAWP